MKFGGCDDWNSGPGATGIRGIGRVKFGASGPGFWWGWMARISVEGCHFGLKHVWWVVLRVIGTGW